MIDLLLLAAIAWQHFETKWTWDAVGATATSEAATHYWLCISDNPADFTMSLNETPALCAPVLEGREYSYFDGFTGRIFQGEERYFSVSACNRFGCSGFSN